MRVDFGKFALFVNESSLVASPSATLSNALRDVGPRLHQMQAALAAAAPDVLYNVEGSRAAGNVLEEWKRTCREPHASTVSSSAEATQRSA